MAEPLDLDPKVLDLLGRHEEALALLSRKQQRKLRTQVLKARRDVLAEVALARTGLQGRSGAAALSRGNTARLAELQALLGRLEPIAAALRLALSTGLDEAVDAARDLTVNHHLALMRATGSTAQEVGQAEVLAAGALSDHSRLLVHRYAADNYARAQELAIRNALAQGVLRGDTVDQMAAGIRNLAGVSDARAHLVVRMEISRAYSSASGYIAEAMGQQDRRWGRMIVEIVDSRNHPFSREANGTFAPLGQPFKVSVRGVVEAAKAMGRTDRGVLWPKVRGYYVGTDLPAHYGERGRVIPWRK